ncbi:MAG: CHAT domain-containing protein [Aphanothece sp. CMT-3BRIN-NPC111]|jgi:CHAT domain-containing protein/predicted Zn-dependent protease|nr:CHAT domain-containing protein [Aphanothece sp. CMT-3BRIN-NPC111]
MTGGLGFGKPKDGKPSGTSYRQFFETVLDACGAGNQEKVYRLLDDNEDKLNDSFAQLVREDAEVKLSRLNPKQRRILAEKLSRFSYFIGEFPRGNRASNIEIAITCHEVLTKFFSRNTLSRQWAAHQNSLGIRYWQRIRGDRAENLKLAISFYKAVLRVRTREVFLEDWAMIQINLGNVYNERGQFSEAITAYKAALAVRTREAFPEDWARTQINLGVTYNASGQLSEAITAFQASLEVHTREALPKSWAGIQNNLGLAYREAGQSEQAIHCLKSALAVRTREAFPENWAMTQYNLATAYSDLGQVDEAITYFRSSLEIFQPTAFPVRCLKAGRDFGKTAFNAGKWEEAIEGYKAAIEAVETSCSWASSNKRRQEILEEAMDVYTQIVQACLNNHQPDLAIEYVERSKARNLVQLFADTDSTLHPKGDQIRPQTRQRLERLKEQIVDKQQQLDNLGEDVGLKANTLGNTFSDGILEALETPESSDAQPPTDSTESEDRHNSPNLNQIYAQRLREELDDLQEKFDEVLDEILESDPAYALTQAVQPIRFQEILDQLEEHTAIIEWYITDERFFTFVITRHHEPYVWQSHPDELSELNLWQQEYLDDYRQKKYSQWSNLLTSRLEELSRILHLDEILDHVPEDCQQLILIPHRYLHLFPLHALNLGEVNCLLDRFPDGVRYAPSCQLLQLSKKRCTEPLQTTASKHLFAIQNPTEDLTFANVEVEAIRSYFEPTNILPTQQATKTAWNLASTKQQLRLANFIHFSCHGYFNFESPLRSALVLSGAKVSGTDPLEDDNTRYIQSPEQERIDLEKCLLLEDIFALDLRPCSLVTLSACETGLSDPRSLSDEYISLPSGFLVAGSPSVVGSQWAVSDLATAFLMIKFYENLVGEGLAETRSLSSTQEITVAVALNEAQKWLRDVTKQKLEEWVRQGKVPLTPTRRIAVLGWLRNMEADDQPFEPPQYWAAFCAIGQ